MTAVAIVLGVAFVSGTYVFGSIKASFGDLFGDVNSGVDLYVSGVSEFGLSTPLATDGLGDQMRLGARVVIAAPSVEGIAQIIAPPPCEERVRARTSPNRVLSRWQWTTSTRLLLLSQRRGSHTTCGERG